MLVDNELEEWELNGIVQALEQDAEMQGCWRNYHLIGDAMRGHLPPHLHIDLNERVTRALEHEPVYMKPRNHPPSTVSNLTSTKTAVGFALAASLSAIAVIGVMDIGQMDGAAGPAMVANAPVPVSAPVEQEAAPRFMYTFTAAADGASMPAVNVSPEAARVHTVAVSRGLPLANDLTDYLMNYQRHAAANQDTEDTLSYLRLVGYGSE